MSLLFRSRDGTPGVGKIDKADRVVSSGSEQLILVDEDDNEIGVLDKDACHDGIGRLHRAFSLFLFDDSGRLLIQQRSAAKRLWPLYWSNSCCSHPRAGETMAFATARRLEEELGVEAELSFAYKFTYQAQFDEQGAENELCWVWLGRSSGPVSPNRNEIAATRLVSPAELDAELAARRAAFTPWFILEWSKLRAEHGELLDRYITPGGRGR